MPGMRLTRPAGWRLFCDRFMDKSLKSFQDSAQRLGLSSRYLPDIQCLEIFLDKKYLFMPRLSPFNSMMSMFIAKDKMLFNRMMKKAGFPVPDARTIRLQHFSKDELKALISGLTFPLVIKPAVDTCGGKDVICDIPDFDSLYANLESLLPVYKRMQIEPYYSRLREYTVLMMNQRILAVCERHRPDEMSRVLNLAAEGSVTALDKKLPALNRQWLRQAARKTGLALMSFDLLAEDIYKPFDETGLIFLEANHNPDISIHESPDFGKNIEISKIILKSLIFEHPVAYALQRLKRSRGEHSGRRFWK